MAKKPKKSEYKASVAEKVEASVSKAEYDRYKKLYSPVLRDWRDDSKRDFKGLLRSRAGADVMQATTGNLPNVGVVESPGLGAERARLAAGAMLEGSLQGAAVQQNLQTDVLAAARNQAAQTQAGLGKVARIGASDVLANASNKQLVRGAIGSAIGNIAGSTLKAGFSNLMDNREFFGGAIKGKTQSNNEARSNIFSSPWRR